MPLAQGVLRLDEHVQAVRAEDADQDRVHHAGDVACIVEGLRHRENARAKRSLQQVDQRFKVAAEWKCGVNNCATKWQSCTCAGVTTCHSRRRVRPVPVQMRVVALVDDRVPIGGEYLHVHAGGALLRGTSARAAHLGLGGLGCVASRLPFTAVSPYRPELRTAIGTQISQR